jgi:hypothetical protein
MRSLDSKNRYYYFNVRIINRKQSLLTLLIMQDEGRLVVLNQVFELIRLICDREDSILSKLN